MPFKQSSFLPASGAIVTIVDTALQVCVHRLRKYLGAYLLQLEGDVDAIVFSAGIGEHSAWIREHSLANLEVGRQDLIVGCSS